MNSDTQPSDRTAYEHVGTREAARWAELTAAGTTSWSDAWQQAVQRFGERIVAVEVETGASITYAALDQRARRFAAWAAGLGERQVALCLDNSIAFLTAAIGLAYAGVTGILLNTREPEERLALRKEVLVRQGLERAAEIPHYILRGHAYEKLTPVHLTALATGELAL